MQLERPYARMALQPCVDEKATDVSHAPSCEPPLRSRTPFVSDHA